MKITEPGVYPDLDAATYRAQTDWLSVSGMKRLLRPSCPAKFKAALDAPEEHKPQFDLGKAVHTAVLGRGEEFVEVAAEDYRTKDARLLRHDAYMAGKVPLLTAELALVEAMRLAVAANPLAAALFSNGTAEVSLFWVDDATGVQCKARLDWLPEPVDGRRLIVPDFKTAVSAEPGEFSRNAARFGYLAQALHYTDGIRAVGLDPDPAFLFVIAEKDPPHVVTIGQFTDADDLKLATAMNDTARRIYRECIQTDTWPGYTAGVAELTLPTWWRYDNEEYLT